MGRDRTDPPSVPKNVKEETGCQETCGVPIDRSFSIDGKRYCTRHGNEIMLRLFTQPEPARERTKDFCSKHPDICHGGPAHVKAEPDRPEEETRNDRLRDAASDLVNYYYAASAPPWIVAARSMSEEIDACETWLRLFAAPQLEPARERTCPHGFSEGAIAECSSMIGPVTAVHHIGRRCIEIGTAAREQEQETCDPQHCRNCGQSIGVCTDLRDRGTFCCHTCSHPPADAKAEPQTAREKE